MWALGNRPSSHTSPWAVMRLAEPSGAGPLHPRPPCQGPTLIQVSPPNPQRTLPTPVPMPYRLPLAEVSPVFRPVPTCGGPGDCFEQWDFGSCDPDFGGHVPPRLAPLPPSWKAVPEDGWSKATPGKPSRTLLTSGLRESISRYCFGGGSLRGTLF